MGTDIEPKQTTVGISVSNRTYPLGQFRSRVVPAIKLLQCVLQHENMDHHNWAGFTTNTRALQSYNFSPNYEWEFWSYLDMIKM